MNKKQIISFLKKLNLDENKYVVISGAAMVLYGFKEKKKRNNTAHTVK